jgi:hypothetical protein
METINAVAEEGDVWKGTFISVKAPANNSSKVIALRESIVYHLKVNKEVATETKVFCVARHHWSRSILRKLGRGHRTKLLTKKDVKEFDSEDGHSRHQKGCNLFSRTLKRASTKEISEEDNKKNETKYVQAPVVDEKTAVDFMNSLTSGRNNRARSRSTVQIGAIVSETKRPPECPIVHDPTCTSRDVEASCRLAAPLVLSCCPAHARCQ